MNQNGTDQQIPSGNANPAAPAYDQSFLEQLRHHLDEKRSQGQITEAEYQAQLSFYGIQPSQEAAPVSATQAQEAPAAAPAAPTQTPVANQPAAPVAQSEPIHQAAPTVSTPKRDTADKKFCTYCGKELRIGAAFCDGCGKSCAVPKTEVPKKKCVRCGRLINSGIYCAPCRDFLSRPPTTASTEASPGVIFLSLAAAILWMFAPLFGAGRSTVSTWDMLSELPGSRLDGKSAILLILMLGTTISIFSCFGFACAKENGKAASAAGATLGFIGGFLVYLAILLADYSSNLLEHFLEVVAWGLWGTIALTIIALILAKKADE